MLKADSSGKLVAAVAGTDFVAPAGLSAYVPTTRTITINGTTFDLSADRSWSIVSGVSSFNTRTGAITLSSSDVTTALGYTPVTNARTLTINGTTFDLSANRSWTIVAGLSSFNTRTGDITLLDTDVTGALGYTPVTNARTITINGTTFDLSANRTWVVDTSSVSTRVIQKFTATASQTTFTITGGYTVGMVDVFLNGVKLDNATEFTASNGSTVVLTAAAAVNDVVEVYKYGGQFIANNTLRQTTAFTATAGQTTFTVSYSVGFVDVFYNGAKLAAAEFTATNGTSIVLGTACVVNDIVEVVAYNYTVGAFTGVGGSGTTNYISKWTASGTLGNSLIFDNGTNVGIGTNSPTEKLDVVGGALAAGNGTIRTGITYSSLGLIGTFTNHNLGILTNGTERMRITSGGNVLINRTTSFWSGINALEINGTETIIGMTNGSTSYGYLYHNGTNLFVSNERTGVSGNVIFNNNGAERMRITSGGNVGIGTSSPAAFGTVNLDVNAGAGGSAYIVARANSNGGTTELAFDGSAGYLSTKSNHPLIIRTNDTERMRITSGGNVGIGTTNPGHLLTVAGNVGMSRFFATVAFSSYTPDGLFNAASRYCTVTPPGSGELRFGYLDYGSGQYWGRIGFLATTNWSLGTVGSAGNDFSIGTGYSGTQLYIYSNGNYAFSGSNVSDRRKKTNINYITTNQLDNILKLKPVTFNKIADEVVNENIHTGFIAQDIMEVGIPNLVMGSEEGGYGLDYDGILALAVKAIQEQQAQIEELKNLINGTKS
jgi:hypothetical protein